ncbi:MULTISPECIES: DNA gyrase inhibitor YacG [Silvimonas]|uniref:DNA gyrase inhibitor YacG n=1 Tax=Silvimonas TaxID=300264 RepID=UPI0024B3A3F8|nr:MULTISPECIES: DNA gyrase inhibitor YacG [Silvimonas]MDR3427153.1 DNA gyrase inhibitor YacG [Silvimonas sp.]
MTQSTSRFVTCPCCKKQSAYSPENPFRPFCSERCRLIDLGQWASESYRVPVESDDLDEQTPPRLS